MSGVRGVSGGRGETSDAAVGVEVELEVEVEAEEMDEELSVTG